MTLNLIGVYRRWQTKKATRRALYALSDEQLLDIGIHTKDQRGEVEEVACGKLPRGPRFTQ